jgi:hypothetical protein
VDVVLHQRIVEQVRLPSCRPVFVSSACRSPLRTCLGLFRAIARQRLESLQMVFVGLGEFETE